MKSTQIIICALTSSLLH